MSMPDIDARLSQSFPGENVTIVVQDLYAGFRPRAGRVILLVEVDDAATPAPGSSSSPPPRISRAASGPPGISAGPTASDRTWS